MLERLRAELAKLIEKRAADKAALDEFTATAEERAVDGALTPEDDVEFTERLTAVKAVDAEIETLEERVADLEAVEERQYEAPSVPNVIRRGGHDVWDAELRYGMPQAEIRGHVERALDAEKSMSDEERGSVLKTIANADRPDGRVARHIYATGRPEYRTAFAKLVNGQNFAITPDEARAIEEVRAASLTDAQGGYAVPFLLDPTIIDTRDGVSNPFRQIARVVQITGDNWQGVSSAGVTASWDGEAAEVSDDAPTLAQPAIPPHKAQAFVPFSIEIGMDWANMQSDIRMMFTNAKDDLEAAAFVNGTGSDQPTGIVTALAGGASEIDTAAVGTFASGDIFLLDDALGDKYRDSASWIADQAIYNKVRQFADNDDHTMWTRLGGGLPPELLGYPAYRSSAMDSTVATGNEILVLGDFENYVIVDRIGLSVELVPHLFATANNRPSGQRGLYAFWRVGGDSVNDNGFRMLQVQ